MPPNAFDPRTMRSRQLPLDPGVAALISVDMQNADCGADMLAEGRAGRVKPPRTVHFYEAVADIVIPNQQRLHAAIRAAGAETIYVAIESLTRDGRDRGIDHKVSGIHLAPGSTEARIIDAVAPAPDEIVLKKTASGAFGATNLDYILRNLGVTQLIVVGVVTHQCVENTVRQGADIGYLVTVVSDACATDSAEQHSAALAAMSGYARICTTADVLTELGAA
ncbi:cysteine hydrolase family protein [Hoeflea prorocentri]|uniref:Cysteine hydrolase n=1 Tax=Hoeflea prorocentri TaxID=1922333 RepID=A0A9X3UJ87_9HYPH|nr:isochorismatase family cysteine hydrolase [Hoeflea prorocentri]MCY6381805.1 cysteine hydrolase [Hoeflea prorocentri]MDA5399605.1 cysteine hydrolase [Hoeflea prorocentri]